MKIINVEVILNSQSFLTSTSAVIAVAQNYLKTVNVKPNQICANFDPISHPILYKDVFAIIVDDDLNTEKPTVSDIKWHVYKLNQQGPVVDMEDSEDDGLLSFSSHLMLPANDLLNLWENLYYDNHVKENLLRYAQTMMEFSDKGVDMNVVSCNRVLLLHGPPGTGKTSLCKALAQKLTVRMMNRYKSGILIEINSHSLFSKYFSESGKLVTKMFRRIAEIVENPNLLVCVLIDEIESLAHARKNCTSGSEPSDAIRVVNAVLTQLDAIKRHTNVLILTTSNITESIDVAFVDRADVKQYLGLPSSRAISKVYASCIEHLIKIGVIECELGYETLWTDELYAKKLEEICEVSVGLSGRSLRKIPFLAHALFLDNEDADIGSFLEAMLKAVQKEHEERKHFEEPSK